VPNLTETQKESKRRYSKIYYRNHRDEMLEYFRQLRLRPDKVRQRLRARQVGMRATPHATISPVAIDLAWAAGFLEGEGSFIRDGRIAAAQAGDQVPDPLIRLQQLFGGSITKREPRSDVLGKQRQWVWTVCGPRARGVMMTIYTFMSSRRKMQIRSVLEVVNHDATECSIVPIIS